jgi:hypothetical protein
MNCIIENKFQHINNFVDQLVLNTLEVNLKSFLDNAFLRIGAWTDVNFNNNTVYNTTSPSRLLSIKDASYADGIIWQSYRKDWVWERESFGLLPAISDPVIRVNNSAVASGYNIDYQNGLIRFNNPLPSNTNIEASYSYRNIQVYRASDAPWWQSLQYGSLKPSDIINQFGNWSIGAHHRVQMPSIIIDAVPRSRNLPHELGSKSLRIEQDIIFNIIAENKNDRNQLLDIVRLQQDNTIWLYDINKIARVNKLPLNYLGNKNVDGLSYQDMINNYKWAKTFIKNVSLSEVDSLDIGLHEGLARATFEIIFDGFND